mgnify:CR=1 FL=1
MRDYIENNISSLLAFFGTLSGIIGGYLTGKKKSNAETDSISLGNFSMGYEVYQKLLNDLEQRYETRISSYEERLSKISNELNSCKEEMQRMIENAIDEMRQKRDDKGRFKKEQ